MADDWIAAYRETDNLNEKYKLLRQEMSRLRAEAGGADRFDPDDVAQTIQEQNSEHEEELIVFAANDFGLPVAFRPESLDKADQDEVRRTILAEKYVEHDDLNVIRRDILDTQSRTFINRSSNSAMMSFIARSLFSLTQLARL